MSDEDEIEVHGMLPPSVPDYVQRGFGWPGVILTLAFAAFVLVVTLAIALG